MCALTEALQPWYRDTAAGPIDQVLGAGAVCWFWDQCWDYHIQQREQNGALKEPGFPGKLCQNGKGFLVFYF